MNNYLEIQDETELAILENIYSSEKKAQLVKQRDLATAAGTSLGMTNTILKRLAQRGLIAVKKINSRNIQYAVTPTGINEIARRSYRYFKRTINNVVFYKDQIDAAVAQAKKNGFLAVILVGISDLDFIIEHSCQRHGLSFIKVLDVSNAAAAHIEKSLRIYAETIEDTTLKAEKTDLFLSAILGGGEKA